MAEDTQKMSRIKQAKLSNQQYHTLALTAEGWTDAAIAKMENRPTNAIQARLNKVYVKLNISDPTRQTNPRVLAVKAYLEDYEGVRPALRYAEDNGHPHND